MTEEDLKDLYRIYEEPSIRDNVEALYEPDRERAYVNDYVRHMYRFFEYGMWIITLKESGRIIGRMGFDNRQVDGDMVPELGYIISEEYQRQGYAYEAGLAALEYMRELEVPRIHCVMGRNNLPSIRLAEKLGFQLVCPVGEDQLLYSLT